MVSGVPQESILGPLLFIMFIIDLPLAAHSPVYMFADDTKIFRITKRITECMTLQSDLDALYNWS